MSTASSKTASISHFLGIDFGEAKIGLSVADSETRIAFSFGMLKNDKELIENLKNIVEKKEISRIVVGNAGEETKDFAAMLEKKLNIPIEFQNEMYSTREAQRNLVEKGAKKIKRFDDQEAARIILQSWLDKKE